jgi:hypothetical protein
MRCICGQASFTLWTNTGLGHLSLSLVSRNMCRVTIVLTRIRRMVTAPKADSPKPPSLLQKGGLPFLREVWGQGWLALNGLEEAL